MGKIIKMQLARETAANIGWNTDGAITYFYKVSPDLESVEVIVWLQSEGVFIESFDPLVQFKSYEIEIYNINLTESTPDFSSETKTTLKFNYNSDSKDEETEAMIFSHEKYLELCMKNNFENKKREAV